jgi:hypothetical protein
MSNDILKQNEQSFPLFAFTCLSSGLLILGQAGCQSGECSHPARLVVSNLQPVPPPLPLSRNWISNPTPPGQITRGGHCWLAVAFAAFFGCLKS